ncbi:hypothetical protein OV090_19570 [Nannocystis sp. RBIL2]|uniref:hypothetical protein n=1 Tax=Nannocystis sp. RBIL2 TaxID=2996788 RepID=UPI0022708384|nr:hypothetical protein [Nannocystis sp. RBIL2]MCY1066980.1 hypothetical protein [Nannocystis sp. RBIL2]
MSGSTNTLGENGTHEKVFRINEYVYGTLDSQILSLEHAGQDILGGWSVEAQFVPE